MAYRDQLKAAQTRLAQLEVEVLRLEEKLAAKLSPVASHSQSSLALTRQLAKLKKKTQRRIAELEEAAGSRAMRRLEKANRELGAKLEKAKVRRRELNAKLSRYEEQFRHAPTLSWTEHNSRRPAFEVDGTKAGVLCPICLGAGIRTEVTRTREHTYGALFNRDAARVVCPRCLQMGWMRLD